jgi:hypothetical protein
MEIEATISYDWLARPAVRVIAMTVKELIVRLQALPNQDALVIIASSNANEWLVATGIVERGISLSPANPDFVVPGNDPGVEII